MPRLTNDQRVEIIALHEQAGQSPLELSQHYQVSKSTITRLLAKHRDTGSVDDRQKSGRPKISSEREDRALIRMSVNNPRHVARQLRQRWRNETGVNASLSTVKDRLFKSGLVGRIARRKPLLTARHKQIRIDWARQRVNWTIEQWNSIFFSDESPIHMVQSKQRRYVRRRGGTAMRGEHLRHTVHSSGGKIDVWGGFSRNGPRPLVRLQGLVNAEVYCGVLQENLLPLDLPGNGLIFQQDNASSHSARRTKRFFDENNIEVLPWPPQSPDLNPIENLWSIVQREVDAIPVQGLNGLWEATQQVWQRIPQELIDDMISSMPRRLRMVIDAHGGSIRY